MRAKKETIRCAVYTRKSTEEGLDQNYNTLDAQRDAGENYIKSQQHEGWEILPTRYDDGGFTGGNMDRPALKKLMEDIQAGKIDVVVVYKIDRLSRSLADFAQMVQIFDEHDVSFVSVTQHFNTKDSMGRLTLNILFSFAQFEREVIGERIRDKFAASKKKGIFMGGAIPLGYQVENRELYIDKDEAKWVRHIFQRFATLKSMKKLLVELEKDGFRTKRYVSGTGKERGGKIANRQYLYRLLKNKIYIGKIVHKDKVYDGLHEAIISQELFDKANDIFKEDRVARGNYTRNRHPALLRGLITCECCDCAMTPSFTVKGSRTYRYYTPTTAIHQHYKACEVGPLPAGEIDALVVGHLKQLITSPEILSKTHGIIQASEDAPAGFGLEELRKEIKDFDVFWKALGLEQQQRIAELLVESVAVNTDAVKINLRMDGFSTITNKLKGKTDEHASL